MLIERGDRDAVGKMKQFATYFTHGVRNGSQLRAEIYQTAGSRGRFSIWWTRFFERELKPRACPGPMKKVQLITDGSCLGNPGPGGWACILRYGDHKKEMCGCEPHTTNNRMELKAAIEGLRALKEKCEVEVVTDSEYVKNGITKWIHDWKRNGWQTDGEQAGGESGPVEGARRTERTATTPNGPGPRATHRTTTTTAATNWPRPRRRTSRSARFLRAALIALLPVPHPPARSAELPLAPFQFLSQHVEEKHPRRPHQIYAAR